MTTEDDAALQYSACKLGEELEKWRLKALLSTTLVTMMLLMNTVTIAFSNAPSAEETRYIQESDSHQTIHSTGMKSLSNYML